MRTRLVGAFQFFAWLALALVVIQFITAGLMVFPGILGGAMEQYYGFHALPGLLSVLVGLLMLIVGLIGRVGGRSLGPSTLFFVLAVAQVFLAHIEPRLVGALHTSNALVLLYLSYGLALGRFRAAAPKATAETAVAVPAAD